MKLKNKLLFATIPAAAIATVMPITMASCSKGAFDDVVNAFEQTEKDVTLIEPTTQVVTSHSTNYDVIRNYVQEKLIDLTKSNTDYLKQDALNFVRAALASLQHPISTNASGYTFNGVLKYTVDEIKLVSTPKSTSVQTPFCAKLSFLANFSFDEDEYFSGKKYTVSVNLTGTIDIDNLFFQVVAKNFESKQQVDMSKWLTIFYAIDPEDPAALGLTFGAEFKQQGTVSYTNKATGTSETLSFTSDSDPIEFSYGDSLVWTLSKAMSCPLAYLAARYSAYQTIAGKSNVVPESISLRKVSIKTL